MTMTDNRLSGLAMIAGQVGLLLTLSLHPSGKISPAEVDQMVHKLIAVHSIALAGLPLMILGALGLSSFLSFSNRLSVTAFVIYSFAIAASLSGIVIDGLVMPHILPHLADAAKAAAAGGPPSVAVSGASDIWHALIKYNAYLDMAFVQLSLVATAVAVITWSMAILLGKIFPRATGIYGLVLGVIALVAVFSGALRSEHALMIIIFGQATWFLIVGGSLCARPDPVV
ncbi:MAG: hypothetical protein WBV36_26895 [Terriglobales bacterium]|jgi:hypothetical protein